MNRASDVQIGGGHYKKYGDVQPWDLWFKWNLNPFQANIIKYVTRYKDKAGKQDLLKAKHMIDKLIEEEYGKTEPQAIEGVTGTQYVLFDITTGETK